MGIGLYLVPCFVSPLYMCSQSVNSTCPNKGGVMSAFPGSCCTSSQTALHQS